MPIADFATILRPIPEGVALTWGLRAFGPQRPFVLPGEELLLGADRVMMITPEMTIPDDRDVLIAPVDRVIRITTDVEGLPLRARLESPHTTAQPLFALTVADMVSSARINPEDPFDRMAVAWSLDMVALTMAKAAVDAGRGDLGFMSAPEYHRRGAVS